jgi:hypothetical protein
MVEGYAVTSRELPGNPTVVGGDVDNVYPALASLAADHEILLRIRTQELEDPVRS